MKIIYIADVRIPTEKAHGLQIFKTLEALIKNNVQVKLILPFRFNYLKDDPFSYYDIRERFKIIRLPSIDLSRFKIINEKMGFIVFWIRNIFCLPFLIFFLMKQPENIIFGRDKLFILLVFFKAILRKSFYFEIHNMPFKFSFFQKLIFKKMDGIIAITWGLKRSLIELGVPSNKIVVIPDGVDLEKFDINVSQTASRKRLNLPLNKRIILYTGHLYKWKGVYALAEVARFFKDDMLLYFVGGTDYDLQNFRKFINAKGLLDVVRVVGYIDHRLIPYYLKAADCLVLPGAVEYDISRIYTSPLKLFEYMTSKRPIVALSCPAYREILDEDNALLVNFDNPEKVAKTIEKILENKYLSKKISEQAYLDVQKYSWDNRAKNIISFISTLR